MEIQPKINHSNSATGASVPNPFQLFYICICLTLIVVFLLAFVFVVFVLAFVFVHISRPPSVLFQENLTAKLDWLEDYPPAGSKEDGEETAFSLLAPNAFDKKFNCR